MKLEEFLATKENAVLDASDAEMMKFAREHLLGDDFLEFLFQSRKSYME